MGLFDTIFGRDSSSDANRDTTKTTQIDKSKTQSGAASSSQQSGTTFAGTSDTAQSTKQKLLTLDPAAQQQLLDMITGTVGGETDDAIAASIANAGNVTGALTAKALGGEQDIKAANAAIVAAARLSGERDLAAADTRNAATAGSTFNSIVQQQAQRGRSDLETQLAGVEGQLNLEGRQLNDAELSAAIQASADTGNLAGGAGLETQRLVGELSQILKGATTEGETTGSVVTDTRNEQQQVTEQMQSFIDLVDELTNSTSRTKGKVSQDNTETPSLFDIFLQATA